ncbi:MAG: T9SS type A sorting domain-containing protein [Aureispira sp.]|nr:T9SS type A sorting domain-containing protein [Aureispira sp.]
MKKVLTVVALFVAFQSAQAQIVINEILYNTPVSSSENEEFVELLNTTSSPINLSGYTIKDNGSPITIGNLTIPANGIVVLGRDSADFNTAYGFFPHALSNMNLSNSGDYVVLKDVSGTVVDSVRYDDAAPWPSEADGDGNSLQLCNAANDNNDGSNWGISQDIAGADVQDPTKNIYGTPGATNNCVVPTPLVYPLYTINQINSIDANGVADSLNAICELRGVVHCIDFDGNAGYQLRIIETATGNGITVYASNDLNGYTNPLEGDMLHVKGKILQFNGLLEIGADSIMLASQGNSLVTPAVATVVDESNENKLIEIQGLHLVNPANWVGATGFTVAATTGNTDTIYIRIDGDSPLASQSAPVGTFNVTGLGSQIDNTNPYTEYYSLMACAINTPTGVEDINTNQINLQVYPNPANTVLNVNAGQPIEALVINNMLGQEVIRLTNTNSTQLQINTTDLDNGIYNLTTVGKGGIQTIQFQVIK